MVAAIFLGVIQLLQCNTHLAGHKGMVRVAVGTVVTTGEEDTTKFHTPGEDEV